MKHIDKMRLKHIKRFEAKSNKYDFLDDEVKQLITPVLDEILEGFTEWYTTNHDINSDETVYQFELVVEEPDPDEDFVDGNEFFLRTTKIDYDKLSEYMQDAVVNALMACEWFVDIEFSTSSTDGIYYFDCELGKLVKRGKNSGLLDLK